MTLRLGGDGAITGCTSLENPDLTVSGLTISGSFDAEKVLVASGTAAAPSYTFSGDTDNGLYYAGTNSIGLATAGANAILIDSSNRVGIGTTSPGSLLDLEFANSRMRFEQESGSNRPVIRGTRTSDKANRAISIGGSDISFLIGSTSTAALTSADEKVRIDSSGNVGIQTTNPVRALQIGTHGSGNGEMALAASTTGNCSILMGDGATGSDFYRGYIQYQNNTDSLVFATAATQRLVIDSSGRLLLNTSSARTNYSNTSAYGPLLNLEGTSNSNRVLSFIHNDSSGGPFIVLGSTGGSSAGSNNLVAAQSTLGFLSWQGADGSGLVEAASIKTQVDGTPGADDMPGRLVFTTTADGASSSTERMRIDSSGNVGIGTNDPISILHTSVNTPDGLGLYMENRADAGTDDKIGLAFVLRRAGGYAFNQTRIRGIKENAWTGTPSTINSALTFSTYSAESAAERMRIDSSGNVGWYDYCA